MQYEPRLWILRQEILPYLTFLPSSRQQPQTSIADDATRTEASSINASSASRQKSLHAIAHERSLQNEPAAFPEVKFEELPKSPRLVYVVQTDGGFWAYTRSWNSDQEKFSFQPIAAACYANNQR